MWTIARSSHSSLQTILRSLPIISGIEQIYVNLTASLIPFTQ